MVDLINTLALVFISAGAFLLIANRLSLSSVPFYILAGLVVGAFVDQPELLELAQWGIAFLVFVFGVSLEFGSLRTVIRDGEIMTIVQLLVVGPLSFGVGLVLGFDPLNALYFSAAATLSSTIVGTGLRRVDIRENLVHGRLAKSVHFLQDVLAVVLLLVLSAEAFAADDVAMKLGYGVLLLAAAGVVHRYLFDPFSRLAGDSQELLLMTGISILIGFLALAEFIGLSIVVGAFAAGLAIKRDVGHLGMLNGIESIKDFFAAIFFVTIGALVSTPTVEVVVVSLTLIVLTAVVKPLVMLGTLLWEGYDARTASLTSLSLDQVSEFALFLAIGALIEGAISPALFDAIIIAAGVTMITSAYTRRHDHRLYETLLRHVAGRVHTEKIDERSRIGSPVDHVVIAGFGRQGRRLAHACEESGREFVVVENDPAMLDPLREQCENYVFGDAMHRYSWEKARVDDARLVISTIDQRPVSERILELDFGADVILRADDTDDARALLDRGALYVVVPDVLASDQLIGHVTAVIEGDAAPGVEVTHREELRALEELGFSSLADRRDLG
ncbi:cation:proton antiporter [Halalkalicoccus sp. NIPERK01]|uniref:cation:proton antiporter n=1 Tax=Halalkalicoccus sp. NIPERK01 TaxID=3053469 RepID=UPI00256EC51D|nr:cation:proton antiporter [Halalkalicoccus sp. NIPERK01]MDL5362704.1 cation:proton antiporter [Halalkalicoccus sp. NIPERK01]